MYVLKLIPLYIFIYIIFNINKTIFVNKFTTAEVAEWSNAPALRAGVFGLREFESRPLRSFYIIKAFKYSFLLYIICFYKKIKYIL